MLIFNLLCNDESRCVSASEYTELCMLCEAGDKQADSHRKIFLQMSMVMMTPALALSSFAAVT